MRFTHSRDSSSGSDWERPRTLAEMLDWSKIANVAGGDRASSGANRTARSSRLGRGRQADNNQSQSSAQPEIELSQAECDDVLHKHVKAVEAGQVPDRLREQVLAGASREMLADASRCAFRVMTQALDYTLKYSPGSLSAEQYLRGLYPNELNEELAQMNHGVLESQCKFMFDQVWLYARLVNSRWCMRIPTKAERDDFQGRAPERSESPDIVERKKQEEMDEGAYSPFPTDEECTQQVRAFVNQICLGMVPDYLSEKVLLRSSMDDLAIFIVFGVQIIFRVVEKVTQTCMRESRRFNGAQLLRRAYGGWEGWGVELTDEDTSLVETFCGDLRSSMNCKALVRMFVTVFDDIGCFLGKEGDIWFLEIPPKTFRLSIKDKEDDDILADDVLGSGVESLAV